MSLNGYYYRIPSIKMNKCPYALAADAITNKFSILHVKDDIVISKLMIPFTVLNE